MSNQTRQEWIDIQTGFLLMGALIFSLVTMFFLTLFMFGVGCLFFELRRAIGFGIAFGVPPAIIFTLMGLYANIKALPEKADKMKFKA